MITQLINHYCNNYDLQDYYWQTLLTISVIKQWNIIIWWIDGRVVGRGYKLIIISRKKKNVRDYS